MQVACVARWRVPQIKVLLYTFCNRRQLKLGSLHGDHRLEVSRHGDVGE